MGKEHHFSCWRQWTTHKGYIRKHRLYFYFPETAFKKDMLRSFNLERRNNRLSRACFSGLSKMVS